MSRKDRYRRGEGAGPGHVPDQPAEVLAEETGAVTKVSGRTPTDRDEFLHAEQDDLDVLMSVIKRPRIRAESAIRRFGAL
jgi:hypothetical protein